MNLVIFILIILLQLEVLIAQSISHYNPLYKSRKLLYDAGKDWSSLTIFGPIRFKSNSQKELENLIIFNHFGGYIDFNSENKTFSFSGSSHFKYKKYYYGHIKPSLTYDKKKVKSSDSINSDFINYQENQSSVGFENSWAIIQFGRGKESWGAGNDIELALSENSSPYDYFLLGSDYGKVRVRYIHGFLEKIDGNINRYITSRGFEWTNKESLIIGFSETIIYSGENRSIDVGYINPMSSHLEVELNNRLNNIGNANANAVWQAHLDYLFANNFRFSLNYLIDEFVIDSKVQIGKEHGKAFSCRIAYTPVLSNKSVFILHGSMVHVGTPTFRHMKGANNFVQNRRPLGWEKGSDGQDFNLGLNFFNQKNLMTKLLIGYCKIGEESINDRVFDPYFDYISGNFPSGAVSKAFYFNSSCDYWRDDSFSIFAEFNWNQNTGTEIQCGFRFYNPFVSEL